MTTYSVEEIIAPLNAFYSEIPLEFSIGLQNFQSIREYTKIPLAPITLIYGQNSAGKSAIHDAFVFIHNYLGGKTGAQEYLDRWASRNRITRPLNKGFIGNSQDIVISISAWDIFYSYFDYHQKYQPESNPEWLPCNDLWLFDEQMEPARFELRFHFASKQHENEYQEWFIREFHLFFGKEAFFQYEYDGFNEVSAKFSINRRHPVYVALNKCYESSLEGKILDAAGYIGNVEIDDDWLNLKCIIMRDDWIVDKTPFYWFDIDTGIDKTDIEYNPARSIRELLEAMLIIPSLTASKFSDLDSVPPLRPIPSRNEAHFRIASSKLTKGQYWEELASEVRDNQIDYLGDKLQPHFGISNKNDGGVLLDYVNHVLQHPLFLNTGYEIIGECRFLLSAQQIEKIQNDTNDDIRYWGQFIESEVTLRLRYVPDNFPVEIEDVGVGVSQIIPVLCAICNASATYIHQPELHLHPKQQSHLGDIFIERINDELYDDDRIKRNEKPHRHFFIETHSEHILLRILRRIRETNRSNIRNKLFGFTAERLCVLYVDKDKNGNSQVIQLRVAENGEFIDRWPHGFFTERDEDLFDE